MDTHTHTQRKSQYAGYDFSNACHLFAWSRKRYSTDEPKTQSFFHGFFLGYIRTYTHYATESFHATSHMSCAIIQRYFARCRYFLTQKMCIRLIGYFFSSSFDNFLDRDYFSRSEQFNVAFERNRRVLAILKSWLRRLKIKRNFNWIIHVLLDLIYLLYWFHF